MYVGRLIHLLSTCRNRLFFAIISVSLAGCSAAGDSYLRNGIGASLVPADLQVSTQAINSYFSLLCIQAGISSSTDLTSGCGLAPFDEKGWTLVVLQGMNDIDRRCDAYLEWLDDKKRSQAPLLSEVNDVGTAATSILGIIDPNSSRAISIVGMAFGLLTNSIENYHSRLLLQIESSTVNSIVIQERFRFRRETAEATYSNRPAAEYALRSYLRICLPFAIESQINDLSTLGSRREVQRSDSSIIQSPGTTGILGMGAVRANAPVTTAPNRPPPPSPDDKWGTVSSLAIDAGTAKAIQAGLCFSGNDADGTLGSKTKAGLKVFEASAAGFPDDIDWRTRVIDLTEPDINALRAGCPAGAKNYLEATLLTTNADLGKVLAQAVEDKLGLQHSGQTFTALRGEIARVRADLQLDNGPANMFADQVTPDLLGILVPTQR